MKGTGALVERIPREEASRVVDVFCDAFHDYPVMTHVLGSRTDDYDLRLRTLIGFFVAARALRGEPLLGIRAREDLGAAATVSYPDVVQSPPELALLREELWGELGAGARARYEACGEAWRPFAVGVPHVHLNMIGVRPSQQGRGFARSLLDAVHDIARETPGARGVTLTTEDPRNLTLYERFGYEVVGHTHVAPTLETWGLFRRV